MSAILSVELVVVPIGFDFHEKIGNSSNSFEAEGHRTWLIQEATSKLASSVREKLRRGGTEKNRSRYFRRKCERESGTARDLNAKLSENLIRRRVVLPGGS